MPIDELRRRYLVEGQSLRQIAAVAGITVQAVRLRCIAHGIPRRGRGGANATGKRWRWSRYIARMYGMLRFTTTPSSLAGWW